MRLFNAANALSVAFSCLSLVDFAPQAAVEAAVVKAEVRAPTEDESITTREGELLKANLEPDEDGRRTNGGNRDLSSEFDFNKVEFEITGVCAPYEVIKDCMEEAFRYWFDELPGCSEFGPLSETTSFTLLSWENADDCSEECLCPVDFCSGGRRVLEEGDDVPYPTNLSRELGKSKKSKGKGSKKGCNGGCRRRMQERFIRDMNNKDRTLLDGGRKLLSEEQCLDALADAILSECDGEPYMTTECIENVGVEKLKEKEADCDTGSKDCTKDGFCCGETDCVCLAASVSLCETEGCCIEDASNPDPQFCAGQGGCDDPVPTEDCDVTSAPTAAPNSKGSKGTSSKGDRRKRRMQSGVRTPPVYFG